MYNKNHFLDKDADILPFSDKCFLFYNTADQSFDEKGSVESRSEKILMRKRRIEEQDVPKTNIEDRFGS